MPKASLTKEGVRNVLLVDRTIAAHVPYRKQKGGTGYSGGYRTQARHDVERSVAHKRGHCTLEGDGTVVDA